MSNAEFLIKGVKYLLNLKIIVLRVCEEFYEYVHNRGSVKYNSILKCILYGL